jgi:sugar (pentulose or hexulose) kinase
MARCINANFTFANFARSLLYSAISTLRIGFDILKNENVEVDKLYGHGGFFKVGNVGASMMASALNTDVSVMESAGEGGAFGIAVLASYMGSNRSLPDYLKEYVFKGAKENLCAPDASITLGFSVYLDRFLSLLEAERKVVEVLS